MQPETFSFKPLGSKVAILPLEVPDTTASGLIIVPDAAKPRPSDGIVLAAGPDALEDVKVGDRVLFPKNAGMPVKLGDQFFVVFNVDDIIAVYN